MLSSASGQFVVYQNQTYLAMCQNEYQAECVRGYECQWKYKNGKVFGGNQYCCGNVTFVNGNKNSNFYSCILESNSGNSETNSNIDMKKVCAGSSSLLYGFSVFVALLLLSLS